MQKDKQYAQRADVLHQEEIDVEVVRYTQGTVVGELVVYQLMRYEPTNQDTSQEAYNG